MTTTENLRRWLFALSLFAACALGAKAQSVRWEPSDSGDPSELQLVFENVSPTGEPQLPTADGLSFTLIGSRNETSIVNFSATRSIILTYRVRARSGGTIQIPAFSVETDKGKLRVAAYRGGAAGASLETVATSTLSAPSSTLWVGEVFPLTYSLSVSRRYYAQVASNVEWTSGPLLVEEWAKPEPVETVINGESRIDFIYRARAYAKAPGRITLESAKQLVNLQTGSVGFGLFQQPRLEQLAVTSTRPEFTIRPLPAGAPASFNGAVGQFTLNSKVVPASAAIGEPITWTLSLTGTGNWPDIPGLPSRDVSKDFQVVQPQAKRTPVEGKVFEATLAEDVVLVPTRAGTYTLGPVSYTYLDPKAGRYVTTTTEKMTVTVTPAKVPLFNFDPSPDPATTATPKTEAAPKIPAPPNAPGAIPRDPLPGASSALQPFSRPALLTGAIAPFGALLLFWFGLALRRARLTDRVRVHREAKARLQATLARLRTVSDQPAVTAPLHSWQSDAAILWQLNRAAPAAREFPDPVWAKLWEETDRTLYGDNVALPSDWTTRAEAALSAKRVDAFSVFQLFLPRNLLPVLVLLLMCSLTVTGHAAESAPAAPTAGDPLASYRKGDFAAAEKSWRKTLETAPTDWLARHNLALALAQQDRWNEAAAHATVAFVQHPRDPSVYWHLAPAFEKAGYTPAPLAAFLQPGPVAQIARLASPPDWQLGLIIAAGLAALALALLLGRAYGWRSRWVPTLVALAFIFALVLAATAFTGLHAYGSTAKAGAVIAWKAGTLRSIPTEADTTQKTTALPAGSIAIIDRTFLGWVRLSFDNGQTGWVRKDEVVPLWR